MPTQVPAPPLQGFIWAWAPCRWCQDSPVASLEEAGCLLFPNFSSKQWSVCSDRIPTFWWLTEASESHRSSTELLGDFQHRRWSVSNYLAPTFHWIYVKVWLHNAVLKCQYWQSFGCCIRLNVWRLTYKSISKYTIFEISNERVE